MDSIASPACMLGRQDQVLEATGHDQVEEARVAPVRRDQVDEATGRDQVLEA